MPVDVVVRMGPLENGKYKSNRIKKAKMEKLIITCAITGGLQGKSANPNIPEQPDEQIQQTIDAWNAGASIVHSRKPDCAVRGNRGHGKRTLCPLLLPRQI